MRRRYWRRSTTRSPASSCSQVKRAKPAIAALLDLKSDKIDWAADGLPPASHQELARDHGPGSRAAKDGHQRYFVNATLSFRYLALNTSRPLFKNAKLRQAVQYAINRPALLAQRAPSPAPRPPSTSRRVSQVNKPSSTTRSTART